MTYHAVILCLNVADHVTNQELITWLSCTDDVPQERPHRRQPTRLCRPWDSPGKKTRVGCHFLLPCMKVKSESEVAQSCPTFSDPSSLPGSSIHGIFQARVLEWGAIAFSSPNSITLNLELWTVVLFL